MFRLIAAIVLSFSLTTAFAKTPAPAAAAPATAATPAAPVKPAAKAKKAVEKTTEAKEASPAQLAQRAKMKACNKDAKTQGLKGDPRKAFMKDCLKKS